MVWRFDQNVSSCQISVDQPALLQIHHSLKHTKPRAEANHYGQFYFLEREHVYHTLTFINQWHLHSSEQHGFFKLSHKLIPIACQANIAFFFVSMQNNRQVNIRKNPQIPKAKFRFALITSMVLFLHVCSRYLCFKISGRGKYSSPH